MKLSEKLQELKINAELCIEYTLIAVAIVIKLILLFVATVNSGYHGNELLHIEAGKHLAFGYMGFPPLIGFLAWIRNPIE